MPDEASEEMLALLNELAGLKEIDLREPPRTQEQKAARKERQQRRNEIRQQIKELGKGNGETPVNP